MLLLVVMVALLVATRHGRPHLAQPAMVEHFEASPPSDARARDEIAAYWRDGAFPSSRSGRRWQTIQFQLSKRQHMTEGTGDHWHDDTLDRAALAKHLTTLVEYRYDRYHADGKRGALCVAIDADWGVGKSFFVERWSKDLETTYPVVRFDAWLNDLSDEPLLGFVGVLRDQLGLLTEQIPCEQVKDFERKASEMLRTAGRAAVAITKEIGKGIATHYLRTAPSDLMEALRGADDALDEAGSDERKEKMVDAIVASAVQSHQDRRTAIESLRIKLTSLVEALAATPQFKAPLFIFVDELDRCRPDYAVALLEGMKHLFDAKGVCFVASINQKQLGEAVKAVYGSGFDGRRYLKRFFSLEVSLPTARSFGYAEHLLSESGIDTSKVSRFVGLPMNTVRMPDKIEEVFIHCFNLVAEEFALNARAQRQVFQRVEHAMALWPAEVPCVLSYTFALAALDFVSPGRLEELEADEAMAMLPSDHVSRVMFTLERRSSPSLMALSDVLNSYHALSRMTYRVAVAHANLGGEPQKSKAEELRFFEVIGRSGSSTGKIDLSRAISIVRTSGYFK